MLLELKLRWKLRESSKEMEIEKMRDGVRYVADE